jgi:DNA-binding MarR family transcriptional regulator
MEVKNVSKTTQKNVVKTLINKLLAQAMVVTESDELSIAALRIFLSIPDSEEGIPQTQLVKVLPDVSATTISRHVSFLASLDTRRKAPLSVALVATYPDPVDRRYRYLKLTPAGVDLQNKLLSDFLERLTLTN